MKITAGGTDGDSESAKDAKFEFTPPELLLDTPFNMGCYKFTDNELPSAEEQNFEMSPASCILKCAPKGSDYRLAGIVRYISIEWNLSIYIFIYIYISTYFYVLGIKDGTTCFCLTSVESLAYVDEPTYCSSSCIVEEAEYPCGGENALSIYVAGMYFKISIGSIF